jgi:hypothetical protein
MGDAMRTALLTSALMLVAAMAWADEPSAPDPKTEAAAETKPAKPADEVAADEAKTAAIATEKDTKRFKPPAGYRPKRINGEQVYCTKTVVLGSRFPREDCRNEAELRELVRNREEMRNDVNRTRAVCASNNGACGLN